MVIQKLKKGLAYVGSGSAASLVSGLYARTLPWVGTDVTAYGFPVSWLKRIATSSPYQQTIFSPGGLLIDVVFWSLLIGDLVPLYKWAKERYQQYKSRK